MIPLFCPCAGAIKSMQGDGMYTEGLEKAAVEDVLASTGRPTNDSAETDDDDREEQSSSSLSLETSSSETLKNKSGKQEMSMTETRVRESDHALVLTRDIMLSSSLRRPVAAPSAPGKQQGKNKVTFSPLAYSNDEQYEKDGEGEGDNEDPNKSQVIMFNGVGYQNDAIINDVLMAALLQADGGSSKRDGSSFVQKCLWSMVKRLGHKLKRADRKMVKLESKLVQANKSIKRLKRKNQRYRILNRQLVESEEELVQVTDDNLQNEIRCRALQETVLEQEIELEKAAAQMEEYKMERRAFALYDAQDETVEFESDAQQDEIAQLRQALVRMQMERDSVVNWDTEPVADLRVEQHDNAIKCNQLLVAESSVVSPSLLCGGSGRGQDSGRRLFYDTDASGVVASLHGGDELDTTEECTSFSSDDDFPLSTTTLVVGRTQA